MPKANDEVARLLDELALLTKIEDAEPNSFRVRAYENAARAVAGLPQDVAQMSASALAGVKGIGKSTAAKIREYVDHGSIAKLDALRERYPAGQRELLRVPGLGVKMLGLLEEVLGVTDLDGLRAAIGDGRLARLPGLGEKTAENLASAIERMHLASKEHRRPIAEAMPVAERLVTDLGAVTGVERVAYAGSLRRFRETVGDLDILVATRDPAAATSAFVGHDVVGEVTAHGDTRSSIVARDGLQVDLRVVDPEAFGAALLYFTGSKAHNIALRQRAIARGWLLNEYGLLDDAGATIVAASEEEIYDRLGLAWISPELREDSGEIELAASAGLPDLVALEDLRGDLHDHSDWSGDGRSTLADMVQAAQDRGLSYLAITDHAEDLRINGVSREGMLAQRRELRTLQEDHPDIRLLHGAELNIDGHGELDYDPAFLAGFDWCVASVHSLFNRPPAEQTARLVAAVRNPAVNVIGHLSGRMLGKRPGIEFDLDVVLDAAVETGTAIEINANLRRLDASAEVIREGASRGVTFVISTDAHTVAELDNHRYGVLQARRGGLPREQVANTWEAERFLEWAAAVRS